MTRCMFRWGDCPLTTDADFQAGRRRAHVCIFADGGHERHVCLCGRRAVSVDGRVVAVASGLADFEEVT